MLHIADPLLRVVSGAHISALEGASTNIELWVESCTSLLESIIRNIFNSIPIILYFDDLVPLILRNCQPLHTTITHFFHLVLEDRSQIVFVTAVIMFVRVSGCRFGFFNFLQLLSSLLLVLSGHFSKQFSDRSWN